MSPPAASASSSGWGAKKSTRGWGGSVRVGTGGPALGSGGTTARTGSGAASASRRRTEAARRRARSDLVALDKASRDHQTLDLVGTLADDHEGRLAVVALDGELLHVAVAAEDAHRLERDLLAGLGGEELGHARLDVHALAAVLHRGGLPGQEPGRLDLGRHVGELQLDRLVLADRLAERPSLLGIADGVLEGRLGDADGACGDVDASHLEPAHHLREAAALDAAHEIPGHAEVLEAHLAGLHPLVPELVELA